MFLGGVVYVQSPRVLASICNFFKFSRDNMCRWKSDCFFSDFFCCGSSLTLRLADGMVNLALMIIVTDKVWTRAWELEDVFWQIQFRVCRNLDIISKTSNNCKYLTWWYLSDEYPSMMKICETLARLVCHNSFLKTDDVRLKKLNRSDRVCYFCDLYEEDNVRHLVMQCPTFRRAAEDQISEI